MRYLLVLLLVGCASDPYAWKKTGASDADWNADHKTCRSETSGYSLMPAIQAHEYNVCMEKKGWQK